MDSNKHVVNSKPSHLPPSAEFTGSPPKKQKHHHTDGKVKKHKHKKHHNEKSVSVKNEKTVTVKKEQPSPPKSKKPMISESDSEDDLIPLAQLKSLTDSGAPTPAPPAPAMPPVAKVKTESKPKPIAKKVKVEEKTSVGAVNEEDIPLAVRKVDLVAKHSTTLTSSTPPTKSAPPKPKPTSALPASSKKTSSSAAKAGTKRKKTSSQTDSDYENDEEFKPKKAKKTPSSSSKSKSSSAATPTATPATVTTPTKKKKGGATKPDPSPRKGAAAVGTGSPTKGGRKKKEEEQAVWKWWEEEPHPEGIKWKTLEHKGPYFAPPYECLPPDVQFSYNGEPMELSEKAEEAAGFFAKMLDHDYTKKDIFCNNFFEDWRKEMTREEASIIRDFSLCDFNAIHQYYKEKSEARKQMTKEEKAKLKEENEKITEEYGWCIIDGHRERIGNFKTEPPGLFRGRGDHPKQGKIKKRIEAEDVTINIGQTCPVPTPPEGHKWKAVQHDNKVTWLASWTENIQSAIKYVMLNPTSRLKGEKDWAKYEVARKLKDQVDKIRDQYRDDWKSKEMKVRQRAVAVYFIDKLALRAGNEKDSDETADTVGCCSLRVEHITLHEEMDGKEYMVEFDFLGKDSIRYYNKVPVEKQVFKNLKLFMENKEPGDDLFDRLTTTLLNKHLSELMPGLTAKVFRTYNASKTLQDQLEELTAEADPVPSKMLSYNRANRAVAILCNHQRAAPKTFDKQMSNLRAKIEAKEDAITETKGEIKALKKEVKTTKDPKATKKLDTKKKALGRLEEQLHKLEVQATDKEENKEIALGTSKLNYLDPRISVAWCKKWDVPVEKIYNKSQRQKFAWAIDMADEVFVF